MASAKKLPSGNWRVQVFTGLSPEGKRIYKSFTAETKKEAEFLAAQFAQTQKDIVRTDLTLREATERYIESKTNVLSPSTVRGYITLLNSAVPDLMRLKIRDINAEKVQKSFNEFAKTHSPKTCRNAHGLISAVLKTQIPDFTLHTTLPQKQKRDIYVPDEAEITRLYPLTIGKPIEIPFLLATQCGLRASEISALTIENVYPTYIDICQARVKGVDGAVLKAPKSLAGYRKVPINAELYEILKESAAKNGGAVCCQPSSNAITRSWEHFRDKYDFDKNCNFHALRHHFASRCLLLGMPQKYVAEMMGHNSLNMIEKVYQHTFPSAMEKYAERLREENSKLFSQKTAACEPRQAV